MNLQMRFDDIKYEAKQQTREQDAKNWVQNLKENGLDRAIAWKMIEKTYGQKIPLAKLKVIFKENY